MTKKTEYPIGLAKKMSIELATNVLKIFLSTNKTYSFVKEETRNIKELVYHLHVDCSKEAFPCEILLKSFIVDDTVKGMSVLVIIVTDIVIIAQDKDVAKKLHDDFMHFIDNSSEIFKDMKQIFRPAQQIEKQLN